jgi:hypothetical protein
VVHSPPEVGDSGAALDLLDPRPFDVGDQQAGGVGSDVDDRYAHDRTIGFFSAPVTASHSNDDRVAP